MSNAVGFLVFAVVMAFIARTSGIATGAFISTENGASSGHGALAKGEYYKFDTSSLGR